VHVDPWIWAVTLVGLIAILAVDFVAGARRGDEPSVRAASLWLSAYVGLALAFAAGLWAVAGGKPALQFGTGYLLEYSLSVDNLFVYLLLMTRFAVPPPLRGSVLIVGIVGTLLLRGPFIVGGVAAVEHFTATFYVFGAILFWTALGMLRESEEPTDVGDSLAVRLARRVFPTTDHYVGHRLLVRVDGRRHATPMLLVIAAVSMTGLVFALDSTPAIFGVTTDTYLIVTANAFALMGLRQLYFVIGGLLARLRYLSTGLAIVLAFIGLKLVFEALHGDDVGWAPEIGTALSLGIIGVVIGTTVVASLAASRSANRRGDG
jgi:tellurite resistance protein TerC